MFEDQNEGFGEIKTKGVYIRKEMYLFVYSVGLTKSYLCNFNIGK